MKRREFITLGVAAIVVVGLGALVLLLFFWHGEEFSSVSETFAHGKPKQERVYRRNIFGEDAKVREVTYFPSGQIATDVEYSNGLVNGWAKEYFESGNIRFTATYKDSEPHGIREAYYESGQLFCLACYHEGELLCKRNWDREGNEIEPLPMDRE